MRRIQVLVATLWVGSLWTVSYIVAPTLFSMLSDKALAGTIAGQLFKTQAWVSIACASLLIVSLLLGNVRSLATRHKVLLAIVSAMLACTLIAYFGLQPSMAALRNAADTGGVMDQEARAKFGMLHGVSAGFALTQSLLGVALILKIR